MSDSSLLKVRNIETFYGPVMAIRGISLDVHKGQIVSILGGNGAGKTTILKTICGALEPQKGTVIFSGQDITAWQPDKTANQGMGHVPEGREVFPFLTVKENLEMGAFSRKRKKEIDADLDMVFHYFPDLKSKINLQAVILSGGQQQMLAMGRALMMRPEILLLDEPSLGLSPLLVSEIFDIICRLNSEQGVTMLLVEQNAHMALKVSHSGYVIEVGRIVFDGDRDALLNNPDIQEFYLGKKQTIGREKRRWKQRKTWR